MPRFLAFLFLLFLSYNLQAQIWEVGGMLGGAGYMGDINPNNPLKISGISAGLFLKRNFDGYWSVKLNYNYGQIAGADSTSSSPQQRMRNLSFQTQLSELSLITEFNFFSYVPQAGKNAFTPFIYVGLGAVGYNPQANYEGKTYDLRPLMTEGESKPYPNFAFTAPYGVGLKYNFSGTWNFIADIGYRNPGTDYLDDISGNYPNRTKLISPFAATLSDRSGEVNKGLDIGSPGSQRGDGRPRDTYMFINISISFTFVSSKCYY